MITHEFSSEDAIELSTQVQQAVRMAIQYALPLSSPVGAQALAHRQADET